MRLAFAWYFSTEILKPIISVATISYDRSRPIGLDEIKELLQWNKHACTFYLRLATVQDNMYSYRFQPGLLHTYQAKPECLMLQLICNYQKQLSLGDQSPKPTPFTGHFIYAYLKNFIVGQQLLCPSCV